VVEPLLAAGWVRNDTDQEESWEYGDSVTYGLERSGVSIFVELYEDEYVLVWPGGVPEDPEEQSEILGRIDDLAPSALRVAYATVGLL
jgi:hypothetical protein